MSLTARNIIVVRHDSVESDDYNAAVELGSFDLCGETYNARFADIYGRVITLM